MWSIPFEDINENDILYLIDNKVSEGKNLDFKAKFHQNPSDSERKELSKDLSSFANSDGGDLVFGVCEKDAKANSLSDDIGVSLDKIEEVKENFLRRSYDIVEPPIPNIKFKHLIVNNRLIIIVRVEKSFNCPHRASDRTYYFRLERESKPMPTNQLRRLFFEGVNLEKDIKQFHLERIDDYRDGLSVVTIMNEPKLLFHFFPVGSYLNNIKYEIGRSNFGLHPSKISSGASTIPTIDGVMSYSGPSNQISGVRACSVLFRNGICEIVTKINYRENEINKIPCKMLFLNYIEEIINEAISRSFDAMSALDAQGPYYVLCSLFDVQYCSACYQYDEDQPVVILRKNLLSYPILKLERLDSREDTLHCVDFIYELIWNTFGLMRPENTSRR